MCEIGHPPQATDIKPFAHAACDFANFSAVHICINSFLYLERRDGIVRVRVFVVLIFVVRDKTRTCARAARSPVPSFDHGVSTVLFKQSAPPLLHLFGCLFEVVQ
jgi:hypothetical protein